MSMIPSDATVSLLGAETGTKYNYPEQWNCGAHHHIHINQTDGNLLVISDCAAAILALYYS